MSPQELRMLKESIRGHAVVGIEKEIELKEYTVKEHWHRT